MYLSSTTKDTLSARNFMEHIEEAAKIQNCKKTGQCAEFIQFVAIQCSSTYDDSMER